MDTIAFPLRLNEDGMLRREDRVSALLSLLQVMARTPAGSWAACPAFGLRDLFEDGRQRIDVASLARDRINGALAELHLENFVVSEVVREVNTQRDVDTYVLTLANTATAETFVTTLARSS